MLAGKRILLVVTGGIAAYKSLELIRRLRETGAAVRCVLTRGGAQFVTPLSLATLSGDRVYSDIFSLTDESEMGHLRLSREADLVVVAPATANLLAAMANGIASDLATTLLLATDRPVLVAPAMNHRMWLNPATRENMRRLEERGVMRIGPEDGPLAEQESGPGRMAEPDAIAARIVEWFGAGAPLAGRRALVTSGPTHEAIDPVRYIANRSSGKQGHAIALALARLGADTVLVSGPTALEDPPGVTVRHVETAREMLDACLAAGEGEAALDVAVCAAAVSDWRPESEADGKIRKTGGGPPELALTENPDILATLAKSGDRRPALVIGFAAETGDVARNARKKLARKGCDWILGNDVSPGTGTFGGDRNRILLIDGEGEETWPELDKEEVAGRLATRVAGHFAKHE